MRITDYQGNETVLRGPPAEWPTCRSRPLRCFVEGADLDVLKTHLVPALDGAGARAGGRREVIGGSRRSPCCAASPGVGAGAACGTCGRARLAGALTWTCRPAGLPAPDPFSARARRDRDRCKCPSAVPEASAGGVPAPAPGGVRREKLPAVDKPFVLSVIAPGERRQPADQRRLRETEADGTQPEAGSGSGANCVSAEGLGLGLGSRC